MGELKDDAQVSSLGTLIHKEEEPKKKQSQFYLTTGKL